MDISIFGYGTYRVTVDYGGGSTCVVSDEIVVWPVTDEPIVSDLLQTVCKGANATVAQLVAEGENIRWYADASGGTALALDTELVDGATYYATQTIDGCESERVAMTVKLENCHLIISNPMMPSRAR